MNRYLSAAVQGLLLNHQKVFFRDLITVANSCHHLRVWTVIFFHTSITHWALRPFISFGKFKIPQFAFHGCVKYTSLRYLNKGISKYVEAKNIEMSLAKRKNHKINIKIMNSRSGSSSAFFARSNTYKIITIWSLFCFFFLKQWIYD